MLLLAPLLLSAAGSAFAADASNATRTLDDRDNIVDYDASHAMDCWSFFDTIYYGGDIWEAFTKKDDTDNEDDTIGVFVSHSPAGQDQPSKPTHYKVIEPGQTWEWSNDNDLRRPNAARFAVFQGKLFLYVAKTYDYETGAMLWQKQIDPIDLSYVSGTDWNPPGVTVVEHRPSDVSRPQVIQGLIVKVVDDQLCILVQYSNTKDLYLITSTDGKTFSGTTTPIHTFAGNDCIVNGDVVTRNADGAPLLAFVTKDDVYGGQDSSGTYKLWTLDPDTKVVSQAATLPDKYKEVAVASGNVLGCAQDQTTAWYSTTALQLWGTEWGDNDVYHMQFVFNDQGTGGSFNPAGRVFTEGNESGHVSNSSRNRLACCIAPVPVSETLDDGTQVTSLQQYAHVWWWGETDGSGDNAHGRSLTYKMDYLKNLGPSVTDTTGTGEQPTSAWVLQGIITGLPPYCDNGWALDSLYQKYTMTLAFSTSESAVNTLTTEKTMSISYQGKKFLGGPSSTRGLSYSNSVQQSSETTEKLDLKVSYTWTPGRTGTRAWGIFFVPHITNDRYELYAPDKARDLDVALYYTYISSGSSLVAKEFDMTAPSGYFSGVRTYPSSLAYKDPRWIGTGPDDNYIAEAGTADYGVIGKEWFYVTEDSGPAETYTAVKSDTRVDSQQCTNRIDISGGAYGFSHGMTGSVSLGSSSTTTFSTDLAVTYGLPPWSIYNEEYLDTMSLDMYLLQATSEDAFWIPDGALANGMQSYPWCLTWHERYWKDAKGRTPSTPTLLSTTQTYIAASPQLSDGPRTALVAKLQAARAAFERGDKKTTANVVGAVINQIKAQAGKDIPQAEADPWIYVLERVRAALVK
jgi:hypothetical protein